MLLKYPNNAYQLFCMLIWIEIVFVESDYTAICVIEKTNKVMTHALVKSS